MDCTIRQEYDNNDEAAKIRRSGRLERAQLMCDDDQFCKNKD